MVKGVRERLDVREGLWGSFPLCGLSKVRTSCKLEFHPTSKKQREQVRLEL